MKTLSFLLAVLVSASAYGQTAPAPRPPTAVCIDDVCPPPVPEVKNYAIFDNFDAAGIDYTLWSDQQDGGTRTFTATSSDVALSGTRSLKSVITRDSASDFRAEVAHRVGNPGGVSAWNRDIWYAVAIYLPANFAKSASRDILVQWHTYSWMEPTEESGTSPLNAIQIRDNNWQIVRNWNTQQPSTLETRQIVTTTIGPAELGTWSRWVCRIKWHWISGESQCWLNGKEVYNVNGGNIANDIYPPYMMIGNYRVANKDSAGEPGVSPRIVYFDNVRAMFSAGSYDAVKP